jgi:FKBP-type peptidyl-prolyl cis-trans isomerase FklB
MRFQFFAALAFAALCPFTLIAQEATQLLTPPGAKKVGDVASYGLGYDIGMNMANGGLSDKDIVRDDFLNGLLDALSGKDPAVQPQAVAEAMQALSKKILDRKLATAKKFLEDNKKKDGVQVTDSGLQYKVIKAGNGATPTVASNVVVHYEGRLIDGEVFDSSIQRGEPVTFGVTQVIKGWTEALLRMKVGDKWQLYIPPELAYGQNGAPGAIGPNEALIFDVELLEVK